MTRFRCSTRPTVWRRAKIHALLNFWTLALLACIGGWSQEIVGQSTNSDLLPAAIAAQQITLPEGFKAALFAGEPDIVQPVAMTFDDRGRLWVVEMLTYSDVRTNFDLSLHDRIVILEDTKRTGHFDKRKVFWEGGQRVTSMEIGFGGVWVLAAPQMLFIPDRNGDDDPDGPPEVLLDGWDDGSVRHNIVNGLKWGPDGWLYGRHGIMATSSVGKPGAPDSQRIRLNCCIWRYHPTRRVFEVVCHGTTNPWGHDWDQYGNLWFVNTVIGHLWEAIPGAWFKRMYGEHLAPRRYELIDQHADHYHWDTTGSWMDSRNSGHGADALGGGHAHSGLMIYQGDNWPAQYRNEVFMINYHGRRINQDHLDPLDSAFVGRHRPDFARFGDPWFRGVELGYGPDGGVYVLDWSDTGECHENDADGVHRDTGRIFKITSGAPRLPAVSDVAKLSDLELVQLQNHSNEWFVRHARRVLQERAAQGRNMTAAHAALRKMFQEQADVPGKLRALWALHATGGTDSTWLDELLAHRDPHVRSWAVTLLVENREPGARTLARFAEMAAHEPSAAVRLSLASAMQRIGLEERAPLARALAEHAEDANDRNLPLMIWYGIEPAVSAGLPKAREIYTSARMPLLRQLMARRLAEDIEKSPPNTERLLEWATGQNLEVQLDVLRGFSDALHGWRKAPQPSSWAQFASRAAQEPNNEIRDRLRDLSVIFGDGRALEEVRQMALNSKLDASVRQGALGQLVEARALDLDALLERMLLDRDLAGVAARGLARSSDASSRETIFKHFGSLSSEDQSAVVGQLVARATSARQLLDAMAQGKVARGLINAMYARQILNHGDAALNEQLAKVWGEIRNTDADKQRLMARYKALLKPAGLAQADLSHGRELFDKTCAVCHRLYGEGKTIGPDLTGSGRNNLDYLLENVVDPSAIVPADYRVSNVELRDDRSLTGIVVAKSERTIDLQMQNERLTIDRADIREIQQGTLSLMPEGLLETLKEGEIRDLIAYLMHDGQVQRPNHSHQARAQ
jgi:putative membrane-bound dehydrogenase-like protein